MMTDREIVEYNAGWLYAKWRKVMSREEVEQEVWLALEEARPARKKGYTDRQFRQFVGMKAHWAIKDAMAEWHEYAQGFRQIESDAVAVPDPPESCGCAAKFLDSQRPAVRDVILARLRGLSMMATAAESCRSVTEVRSLLEEAQVEAAVYGLVPK